MDFSRDATVRIYTVILPGSHLSGVVDGWSEPPCWRIVLSSLALTKTLAAERRKPLTNAFWVAGDQEGGQGQLQGAGVTISLSLEGRGDKATA